MNPATPATAQAELNAARPGSTVVLAGGTGYPILTVPPQVTLNAAWSTLAGLIVKGAVNVLNYVIDGGGVRPGIQCIDGINGASFVGGRVQNVTNVAVFQQDNTSRKPSTDITITDLRARDVGNLGILFSKCFRVRQKQIMLLRVAKGGDTSHHAWYEDDDKCAAHTGEDLWALESAQGFRGCPSVADRMLAYRCTHDGIGVCKDVAHLRRVIVIDCPGTAIGIQASNPWLGEDFLIVGKDQAGYNHAIELSGPTPLIELRRGVVWGYSSNQEVGNSFNVQCSPRDGHDNGGLFVDDYLVASGAVGNPVVGRIDVNYGGQVDRTRSHFLPSCQFAKVTEAQVLDPTRTLERFAAEELGLPGTLDALYESNSPNLMRKAHDWIMAGFGM